MSESLPSAGAPRALPPKPNLEHLRGQAKTLLDALHAGDAAAVDRMSRAVPHARAPWQLADAQVGVAREYGFASWPKLVAHVEASRETLTADAEREHVRQAFGDALHAGDVATVRALFDAEPVARALVNAPIGTFGQRPIFDAKGNAALLDLLIAHGADINLKSDWPIGPWGVLDTATPAEAELLLARGATIDITAAAHLDRLDVLAALLDADPSLVNANGGDGGRPLHFATSVAAIDLLLSRGAEVDARDVDHDSTPLQWQMPRPDGADGADRAQRFALMRRLIERGAAIDIFAAVALDDVALVRRALDEYPGVAFRARVNTPGYPPCALRDGNHNGHMYAYKLASGQTPYDVAGAFGSAAALALLMERSTPLQRLLGAVATGEVEAARALLANDPLLLASMTPEDGSALPAAAWGGNAAAVIFMLDLGFDPFARGPDGGTALHCAAWRGLHELVERILAHPRVLPVRDALIASTDTAHQSTPLGWCCHGSTNCRNPAGDYPRIARALVAAGAVSGPNLGNASPEVRAAIGA